MESRHPPGSEEELKEEVCRVMRRLFNRGLISAISGNVSARLPDAGEFWITPSGVFKGDLKPNDLVKLDLDGNVIEGSLKPSIETPFHAAIYRRRNDVNAVVHSHNPITSGLTLVGIKIKPATIETATMLGEVKVVPWALPGTKRLANLVSEYIEGAKALVLMNHGVIGVGRSLLEAEAIVEALEEAATVQFIASLFARDIPLIPEEDIELMKKLYGGQPPLTFG
ncbi:MAG: class II aldolase/adducin family protein [Candidatus Bathyarchaeia archaeon]